ncbi:ICOS ligand-like isoform 1-T2 [Polymixia lowei]
MCPHWAMPALWRTGLLLSFISYSASLEEACVLGVVGQPISLPCFYNGLKLDSLNFSIEWRRDKDVVLRSVWEEARHVEIQSMSNANSTTVSSDAPQTGNFSLELSAVDPQESQTYYSLFLIIPGKEQSPPICRVCFRTAARFSSPLLKREEPVKGDETVFMCHSSGGFPEPAVRWLVDETEEPPDGSIRTFTAPLPGSLFYNITSHLIINISQDTSVSCVIENQSMNETLTSTSYGVRTSPVARRAAEAMWIFSTALCVVVGLMIFAALVYQIHLDRTSKRHCHSDKGHKDDCEDCEGETVVMNSEQVDSLTETDV